MKTKIITNIEQAMLKCLDNSQLEALHTVLEQILKDVTITASAENTEKTTNADILSDFISAKKIEGCSDKSLKYYEKTITSALNSIDKGIKHITTDDLRSYMTKYQEKRSQARLQWIISGVFYPVSFHGLRMKIT